jgi:ABC-type iron transport system FetAB permease component
VLLVLLRMHMLHGHGIGLSRVSLNVLLRTLLNLMLLHLVGV